MPSDCPPSRVQLGSTYRPTPPRLAPDAPAAVREAHRAARRLPLGTPTIPKLDQRSRAALIAKAERARLLAALGRPATPTDSILIDEIARLRVRSAVLAASPDPSPRETVAVTTLLLECLRRLGLQAAPDPAAGDPAAALRQHLAARPATSAPPVPAPAEGVQHTALAAEPAQRPALAAPLPIPAEEPAR